MAQANTIRQAHGFRVPVDKGEWQSTDLRFGILRAPFAPCGEESRSGHTGWTSLGSPQLATQLKQLASEQGKGEREDCAGYLGSCAYSDHARPLRGQRPRR